MRKTFILALLALVLCGARAVAQSSLMATLSHDGQISTFYGASALQQAHEAADHGDVITLSSGSFAGLNMTKAVTIRGAGMEVDTVHAIDPTVITEDFNIDIADSVTNILTMEGIYHNQQIKIGNLKNAMFLKCRFNHFRSTNSNTSIMKDLNFINCRIAYGFFGCNAGSASFINSVVRRAEFLGSDMGNYSLVNSIVFGTDFHDSEFKNCILVDVNSSSDNSYYNNLFIIDNTGALNNIPNTTNVRVPKNDERIANLLGDYSDSLPMHPSGLFRLTSLAEVGSSIPFDRMLLRIVDPERPSTVTLPAPTS